MACSYLRTAASKSMRCHSCVITLISSVCVSDVMLCLVNRRSRCFRAYGHSINPMLSIMLRYVFRMLNVNRIDYAFLVWRIAQYGITKSFDTWLPLYGNHPIRGKELCQKWRSYSSWYRAFLLSVLPAHADVPQFTHMGSSLFPFLFSLLLQEVSFFPYLSASAPSRIDTTEKPPQSVHSFLFDSRIAEYPSYQLRLGNHIEGISLWVFELALVMSISIRYHCSFLRCSPDI